MTFKDQSSTTPLINFIRQNTTLSRRSIHNHIIQGMVTVNKIIIYDSTQPVSNKDIIELDKKRIKKEPLLYYKFNKPLNVISTMDDPQGRKSLLFFLKKHRLPLTLKPIGRLDRYSSGLLLFSNDGQFIQTVLHPKFLVPKQYKIGLNKPLLNEHKLKLMAGFFLEDGPVKIIFDDADSTSYFTVTISIGRNRILRRSFESFGYEVKELHRITIGNLSIGGLKTGLFEQVEERDIKKLVLNTRN